MMKLTTSHCKNLIGRGGQYFEPITPPKPVIARDEMKITRKFNGVDYTMEGLYKTLRSAYRNEGKAMAEGLATKVSKEKDVGHILWVRRNGIGEVSNG